MTALSLSTSSYTIMDVCLDTKQLAFLPVTPGVLHDGTGSTRFLFLTEVPFFSSATLILQLWG
jgi:hypothetical protein